MSCWYSIQNTVCHDSFYWFQSLVYKVLHTIALVEEYQWHFDVSNWQSCDNIRSARSAIRASDSLEQAGGAKRLIYGGSIAPLPPLVIQCIICADCRHITLDTIRMWSVLCQAKKIAWEQWRFSKMQNYTIVQRRQCMHLYRKRKKCRRPYLRSAASVQPLCGCNCWFTGFRGPLWLAVVCATFIQARTLRRM